MRKEGALKKNKIHRYTDEGKEITYSCTFVLCCELEK